MKREITGDQIIETLTKLDSKEWKDSISSRLESMRSYFSADEWNKGVVPYLRSVQGHAMLKMIGEAQTEKANDYLRGFVAAIQLVVSMPNSVETAIKGEVDKKEKSPQGSAGY